MSSSAAQVDEDLHPNPNGTELNPTDACYEYWPANEERMPILSWCAQQLLAGDTGATWTHLQQVPRELQAGQDL